MNSQNRSAPAAADITADRVRYAKAFGACAPVYERARHGYPPGLISDIQHFAAENGISFIAEVGAGSGKATVPMAKMNIPLDCIEPSRRMSEILRANCAGFPNVTISTTTFERWRPRRRYCLLLAAQSWHLVDPAVRLIKAAEVLRPGGTLALFWNQPPQPASEPVRRAVDSILCEQGLGLIRASRPVPKPAAPPPLERSPDFAAATPAKYRTTYRLAFSDYIDVLQTYPEYSALGRPARQRISDRLSSTVFAQGYVDGGHYTTLHLARRT